MGDPPIGKLPSKPIAIIGSSCRFAGGVTSPSDLWKVLSEATDLSQSVPSTRFSIKGFFHPDPEHHGTTNASRAYWLEQDHRAFDAHFFNITPKEAESMDPQQRLALEVTYEALEAAGYTLKELAGKSVAVMVGVMGNDYDTLTARDDLNASQYMATGNARSIISNRISYFFDLRGPSMTIDTACSASLVALHQAVQSLRSGEAPMACVIGTNLILAPEPFIAESNLHMLSPSGHCQMWDAKADGYARGEGVAALFLKPLSQALADGDNIQAIIRETGVNSDGRTKGITMPSSEAQTSLIRQTYQKAGLDSFNADHRPQFFEAHGTGTPVGDPIEAQAIAEAFFNANSPGSDAGHDKKLLVGSVKTVIGHTEGAAGLAGILKVVQAMDHGLVPPNLHLSELSTTVAPFYNNLEIPKTSIKWPTPPAGHPLRASVNSFGFGGTNAHAIIEKYQSDIHNILSNYNPPAEAHTKSDTAAAVSTKSQNLLPLCFSAATEKSLTQTLIKHRDYMAKSPELAYETISWHLLHNRTTHAFRTTIVAQDIPSAVEALDEVIANSTRQAKVDYKTKQRSIAPKVLGVFTGQGAQYANMASQLFQVNGRFRITIKDLDEYLQRCPDPPEVDFIQNELLAQEDSSRIYTAKVSQVLCTALQIALIDVLEELGVSFHAIIGHSSGEIAAAYAAKRLTRRDAILIAYYRGKYTHLAGDLTGGLGGMLACGLSREQASIFCSQPEYHDKLHVAAHNSPTLTTLSGDVDTVQHAVNELKTQGVFVRQLNVDVAYHSPRMQPAVVEYSKALENCGIQPLPQGDGPRWFSSVEVDQTENGLISDLTSDYWCQNMLRPVLFQEAIELALKTCGPFDCAIEVGPHPALKSPSMATIKSVTSVEIPYLSLLDRTKDDRLTIAAFVGNMWTYFGPNALDIAGYAKKSQLEISRLRLHNAPSYAWDHSQIHWRESRLSEQFQFRKDAPHELLGVRTNNDTQYQLRWRNVLKLDKISWVEGHKFQGQALLPASAYCIMALDAAKTLLNGRKVSVIELLDLDFVSGIPLDDDTMGVETLFTLSVRPPDGNNANVIEADFDLMSVPLSSYGIPPMRKNFQGRIRITLDSSAKGQMPRRRPSARAETLPVNIAGFYTMLEDVGLEYAGPFRALKSLNRRLNYAVATLDMRHEMDTTRLLISPAMLDTCLQTSFATFSSPGDKSLWTTFLPTRIDRLCFNMFGHNSFEDYGDMLVETFLTSFKEPTPNSAATITSDVEVYYSRAGRMAVQVEGLTVSSFASAKPADDYELYLHTTYQLDPEEEIITALSTGFGDMDPFAVKGQKDIRRRLPRRLRHEPTSTASPADWRSEMPGLRPTASDGVPSMPKRPTEARLLPGFRKLLNRIVQQIAHKYPRMTILDLTAPDAALTEPILKQLHGAFLSYNIGHHVDTALVEILPTIEGHEKIKNEALDGDFKNMEPDTQCLNDLIILSSSCLPKSNSADRLAALKRIREMIRDGGFLIFVDMLSPSETAKASKTGASIPIDPPNWSHWFKVECDFPAMAKNCDQTFPGLGCLYVRQAAGRELARLSQLRSAMPVLKHLLIVGCQVGGLGSLNTSLKARLKRFCGKVSTVPSVGAIPTQVAESCTAVILLADINGSVCASMTETSLEILKTLVRPGIVILWVTKNARDDPDQAAVLGLTRSLKAETPNLTLQVLDFDRLNGSVDIIYNFFSRLCTYYDDISLKDGLAGVIRQIEPEVHVGLRGSFIPRVLPYRPANDRLNAYRRVVIQKVNIWDTPVQLHETIDAKGAKRHGFGIMEDDPLTILGSLVERGLVTVEVEYSSLHPVPILGKKGLYVYFGRKLDSGGMVVGLSEVCGPIVRVASGWVRDMRMLTDNVDKVHLVTILWHMMCAIAVVNHTEPNNLVLVEPDCTLLQCVARLLTHSANNQTPERRLLVLSSDRRIVKDHAEAVYTHPWSTARDIRNALTLNEDVVVNFPDSNNRLTGTIASMRGDCKYLEIADLLTDDALKPNNDAAPSEQDEDEQDGDEQKVDPIVELWKLVTDNALVVLFRQDKSLLDMYSAFPSQILDNSSQQHYSRSTVVNWIAESTLDIPLKPIAKPQCLRHDRTYVLVGLTRDLGQSICRLFIEQGARNIVIASRNPDLRPNWVVELNFQGANVVVEQLDVTFLVEVRAFQARIAETMPEVGGVINGAMVLDDRVFSHMDIFTWTRVLTPKTIGSRNLDIVYDSPDLEFFIMMSSFAAIGGHAGQANYAAANMFMNGLAMNRRERGLAGSAINIGVIYGLGLLARENRQGTYDGLERDGYPPISERDLHHMFLEAIEAGRPIVPNQVGELTTGLARYRLDDPRPAHWHHDRRFCHFTVDKVTERARNARDETSLLTPSNGTQQTNTTVQQLVARAGPDAGAVAEVVQAAFCRRVEAILQHPAGSVPGEASFAELGVDSLAAVEIRNWVYKAVGQDVPVMKILGSTSIARLCIEIAEKIVDGQDSG